MGEILWRRQLVDEWKAPEPIYGFGTTALEVNGVLVVPGGSETHAVVGLDPADGRLLWSAGALGVNYSTPVRYGPELLVASARDVIALDPKEGRELWSFRHSEEPPFDPTYPQLQPLDDGLLLVFQNEFVRYRRDGDEFLELWRSAALKSSVAIPVVYGEHLYGFSGTFLTCVALEDGQTVWKSRTPRGRGVIRVDDRLVVLGVGGTLTVARADPAGYREVASLDVTDHGGYTAPSFADGRIYLRNLSEIASVSIDSGTPARSADAQAERFETGAFCRLDPADRRIRATRNRSPGVSRRAIVLPGARERLGPLRLRGRWRGGLGHRADERQRHRRADAARRQDPAFSSAPTPASPAVAGSTASRSTSPTRSSTREIPGAARAASSRPRKSPSTVSSTRPSSPNAPRPPGGSSR